MHLGPHQRSVALSGPEPGFPYDRVLNAVARRIGLGTMSMYTTLWQLRFPRAGDAYEGCEWIDVFAQGVPAHIGTRRPATAMKPLIRTKLFYRGCFALASTPRRMACVPSCS